MEGFFRALKEQVICGRVFETPEEVRLAVSAFVELYPNRWLSEKNGCLSPRDARRACCESEAA